MADDVDAPSPNVDVLPPIIDAIPVRERRRILGKKIAKLDASPNRAETDEKRRNCRMAQFKYYTQTRNLKPVYVTDEMFDMLVDVAYVSYKFAAERSGVCVETVHHRVQKYPEVMAMLYENRKRFISVLAETCSAQLLRLVAQTLNDSKFDLKRHDAKQILKNINQALMAAKSTTSITEKNTPAEASTKTEWKNITKEGASKLIDLPLASDRALPEGNKNDSCLQDAVEE